MRLENNFAEELEIFKMLSATGKYAPADNRCYGNGWPFQFVLYFWSLHSPNSFVEAFRIGGKHALEKQKNDTVKRAANGRRLIGKASRAKVKQAASDYQHSFKDRAAAEMANLVNLEPGTIRRYLSELFPGKNWAEKL